MSDPWSSVHDVRAVRGLGDRGTPPRAQHDVGSICKSMCDSHRTHVCEPMIDRLPSDILYAICSDAVVLASVRASSQSLYSILPWRRCHPFVYGGRLSSALRNPAPVPLLCHSPLECVVSSCRAQRVTALHLAGVFRTQLPWCEAHTDDDILAKAEAYCAGCTCA